MASLPAYLAVDPAKYYDVNALNREVGQSAAERAVAGGYAGSPFAANQGNFLRFSEQQKFLQPYLEREQATNLQASAQAAENARQQNALQAQQQQTQAELASRAALQREAEQAAAAGDERRYAQAMQQLNASQGFDMQKLQYQTSAQTALQNQQNAARLTELGLTGGQEMARQQAQITAESQRQANQLAAQAADRAISEQGLSNRLSEENANRLQTALLTGNQALQREILTEAGATVCQIANIKAGHDEALLRGQQDLQRSLLLYAASGALSPFGAQQAGLPSNLFRPQLQQQGGYGGGASRLSSYGGYGNQTQPSTPMGTVQGILSSYGLGSWPGNDTAPTASYAQGSGSYAPLYAAPSYADARASAQQAAQDYIDV